LDLDFEIGFELIQKAYKKELDNKLWQRWLVDYARMDDKTFIGFEEYKNELLKPARIPVKPKAKTKKEIFEQSDRIIEAWKKGGCK